jgi:hypothetical protein
MIALRAPGHKEITMADQTWTWPAGRVLILYHWSWFDQNLGEIIAGWSQRSETDDADYIHLEAERLREAETVRVDQEGRPLIEPYTFSAFTGVPHELSADDGAPLPWVRALLGG